MRGASLGNRSINAIFSVDVFNEGVDIKEVDTIFMLRPTESATVFLQQLGRGLRRTESKPILTILDFVGNQREEFRWDLRLRALTGGSRRSQKQKVIDQFPTLPSGCRIVFDKTSQEIVLASLQRQLTMRWKDMVRELQSVGDITFGEFLDETELPLANLVKDGNKSWTRRCQLVEATLSFSRRSKTSRGV
ncbi:helicase-related protein [Gordonia sp. LUNF6]|uniref:helicase-related protein n=1 Tax=Gordonia sp. LUNF6 TaxID=3388658 RepID=UPI00399A641A